MAPIHSNDGPIIAILDTKPLTSGSLPPAECARPGLHEFLEAIYPYYDSEFMYISIATILTTKSSLYMVPSSTTLDRNPVANIFHSSSGPKPVGFGSKPNLLNWK